MAEPVCSAQLTVRAAPTATALWLLSIFASAYAPTPHTAPCQIYGCGVAGERELQCHRKVCSVSCGFDLRHSSPGEKGHWAPGQRTHTPLSELQVLGMCSAALV